MVQTVVAAVAGGGGALVICGAGCGVGPVCSELSHSTK
jgi:hypothetical protein